MPRRNPDLPEVQQDDPIFKGRIPSALIADAHTLIADATNTMTLDDYPALKAFVGDALSTKWTDDEVHAALELAGYDQARFIEKTPADWAHLMREKSRVHAAQRRARVVTSTGSDLAVLGFQDPAFAPKAPPPAPAVFVFPPSDRERLLSKFPSLIDVKPVEHEEQ